MSFLLLSKNLEIIQYISYYKFNCKSLIFWATCLRLFTRVHSKKGEGRGWFKSTPELTGEGRVSIGEENMGKY